MVTGQGQPVMLMIMIPQLVSKENWLVYSKTEPQELKGEKPYHQIRDLFKNRKWLRPKIPPCNQRRTDFL